VNNKETHWRHKTINRR